MLRRCLTWSTALGCALTLLCASARSEEKSDRLLGLKASITYLAGDSAYIDAGQDEGVRTGDKIEVVRGDVIVAVLAVTDVSSHKSACRVETPNVELKVGDTVRFIAHGTVDMTGRSGPGQLSTPGPEQPATDTPKTPAPEKPKKPLDKRLREMGMSGRVGVRYLAVRDRTGFGSDVSQPALDLRFDARGLAGTPLELSADVRSRRTYRTVPDGPDRNDSLTRIYRLSAGWHPKDSDWRVTAGRQITPSLSAISIYDGISAEYSTPRWRVGAIAGSQPDQIDQGFSTEVREYGAYYELRQKKDAKLDWELTTGLIGSYQKGEINREFLYVQGMIRNKKLMTYLTQEVDINRGWKADAGESAFAPTSTFLMARYQFTDRFELNAGYDDRRNVRLYLDLVTPETDFDERQRRGVWLGARWRFAKHFRVGGELRTDTASDISTSSNRYTVTFGADTLSKYNIDARTRSTRYTNERTEGWLHSISAGMDLGQRTHFEVTGGTQNETSLLTLGTDRTVNWLGLDVDVTLGRRWLLLFSGQRTDGDDDSNDQLELGVSWRF